VKTEDLKRILDEHRKWLIGDGDCRANLRGADLRDADLRCANLSGADLSGADLRGADLRGACLGDADLRGADMGCTCLGDAKLSGANLKDAALPPLSILPEGEIIGWKKAAGGKIVKLLIPADARRVNSTGRKCRCEFAIVSEIWYGQQKVDVAISTWDGKTIYEPGSTVHPDSYNPDFRVECSNGIHFYITREEAEAHQ
jgi:hypothetical protein